MNPPKRLALFAFILLLGRGAGLAQLVIGQFEDEAPVRTWNIFGIPGAATTSLGGTQFALALDASAIFANPSAAARLPGLSFSGRGSYQSSEFFRFASINTGVIESRGNPGLSLWALDSAAVTYRLGGWGLGLGYGLLEAYSRPRIDVDESPDFTFHFEQTGALRVFNFSLARSFGSRLAVGAGLNLLMGELNRLTEVTFFNGLETILTSISQKFSGIYVSGGLFWDLTDSVHLGAVVRSPFTKKGDDTSVIARNMLVGRGFEINAASEDEYRMPLSAGLGLRFDLTPDWLAACDLTWFNWAQYKVSFFGETPSRDFRDSWKVCFGTQYSLSATLFGAVVDLPIRAGFQFDPQPMRDPRSSYFYYSFGTGIRGRHLFLDVGFTRGSESGSGHSLNARSVQVSLGARI